MNPTLLPITSPLINPHHDLLANFTSQVTIKGSKCLCIGYDEDQLRAYVLKYKPKEVVLLTLWDDHQDSSIKGYEVVIGDIGKRTTFEDNSFDFVITFSVLEHISDLESAFIEISRILKPDGYFASLFGPAWSCSVGHHFYARPGDPLFDFCQWQLPSHIHLLSDTDEIADFYKMNGASEAECATVQEWFFETEIINRRFFEDYLWLFLRHFYLVGSMVMYSEIDPSVLEMLRSKYKEYSDFSTYGGSFLLKNMPIQIETKPANSEK
jgi:SAM-dependent methyltransferase